jgi:VanZ family protein
VIERLGRLSFAYERLPIAARLAAVAMWGGLIWVASSREGGGVPVSPMRSWLNNGAHVGIYFVLGALVWLAVPLDARRRSFVAVAVCATYGFVDEWHQSFVPGRTASVFDWVSDVCGGLLAVAVMVALRDGSRQSLRTVVVLAIAGVAASALATFG